MFIQAPENLQKHQYDQLTGASLALELSRLCKTHSQPFLVIVKDNQSARELQQELNYFLKSENRILRFPDWETLPYDSFSPHQDIISERIEKCHQFLSMTDEIIIIPISTLIQKIAPRSFIEHHSLIFKVGQILDLEQFVNRLVAAGYQSVSQVYSHGEFTKRGSILDLFPSGFDKPFRIDLFDNEIDSIRTFDPETQRSLDKIEEIKLLPANEFVLNEDTISLFRQNWRSIFEISREPECIYQQVSKGIIPQGIEYYLPFLHEHLETIFDYLPENLIVIEMNEWQQSLQTNWDDITLRHGSRKDNRFRPAVAPESLYLKPDHLYQCLKSFPRICLFQEKASNKQPCNHSHYKHCPDVTLDNKNEQLMHRLKSVIAIPNYKTLIAAETQGRLEQLKTWLQQADIRYESIDHWSDLDNMTSNCAITVAPIFEGFVDNHNKIQFISESQLYGDKVRQQVTKRQQSIDTENIIRNLAELQVGSTVVHLEHGIGKYLGLVKLEINHFDTEFLALEYAGGDKFYVPVQHLDMISRYSGNPDTKVTLSKLGNETWAKARAKAAEKVRDVAAELLDIHAQRKMRPGQKYEINELEYRTFAASFAFEETIDQMNSIDAIIQDLNKPTPMDRLVCGDVGFGKTEVAMRAAFIVASCGAQVSILVPTTLLAQQHFENFKDRFADWPFSIEVLSRFVAPKRQKEILLELKQGKVDIVIGTHKLLQKDIEFKQLGLMIVDEEHRFGVRQKEKLKSFKTNVDILSLTATPIPRTLNLSLSGLRDLSILATPPQKRLAVKTFVRSSDDLLIKDAISRELRRGGQVFYLHNDVATINRSAEHIQSLFPDARIVVAHGQMKEKHLEKVMQEFYHHRHQILVCTTIIETGIDIPNANTIIIDRADHFGLAQLHQLRGRVGRSHHQAYAYLLTPSSGNMITNDAKKRLQAIESMDQLGSGFLLASQDLEIRGAGEILGDEQSGQIQQIGFNLYMEMLDNAVEALKSGKSPGLLDVLKEKAEVELQIPALLPDDYIPDVSVRLNLYKRIASAVNTQQLDNIKVELIDRFGLLTPETKNLFAISTIRQKCNDLGIKKIQLNNNKGMIEFIDKPNVDPMEIINLVQQEPHIYGFDGPSKLTIHKELQQPQQRLSFIQQFLAQFEVKRVVPQAVVPE